MRSIVVATGMCILSAGCAVIPKDGPATNEIVSQASVQIQPASQSEDPGYVLIKASNDIAKFMNDGVAKGTQQFPAAAKVGGSTDIRLQAGDRISLTIYEAGSGGLFIPSEPGSRQGNFVQVPSQQIDARGQIVVPYAGIIQAAGKVPSQVTTEIVARLSNRAIEPQVVLSIDERKSNDVSVLGEVSAPLRFAIDPGGTHLTGALARAGGPRYPDYESYVTVQRGKRTFRADLSAIIKNPDQDLRLGGGDVIYVGREPKTYMVFGATPNPGSLGGQSSRRFNFDTGTVTLAEALAKAGGLADLRANPSAVFLYRPQSKRRLEQIDPSVRNRPDNIVPTVFSFDLRRGDALFLTQNVLMQDKDVIFVGDSESVDLIKLLNVVRAANATVGEIKDTSLLFR